MIRLQTTIDELIHTLNHHAEEGRLEKLQVHISSNGHKAAFSRDDCLITASTESSSIVEVKVQSVPPYQRIDDATTIRGTSTETKKLWGKVYKCLLVTFGNIETPSDWIANDTFNRIRNTTSEPENIPQTIDEAVTDFFGEMQTTQADESGEGETTNKPGDYDLQKISDLLNHIFNEEELRDFCLYEQIFRPINEELKETDSKKSILRQMLDYANRKGQVPHLLEWAKTENRIRYEQGRPYELR